MFIVALRVEGFKSLADLELRQLEKINVFHGLNDVGKSNILEAIEVLCRLLPQTIVAPEEGWLVDERRLAPHTFDSIFRRQNLPTRRIRWTVEARVGPDGPPLAFALTLEDEQARLEWNEEPPDSETQRQLADSSRFARLSANRYLMPEVLAQPSSLLEPAAEDGAPGNLKRRLFGAFAGDDQDLRTRYSRLKDLLDTYFAIGELDVAMTTRQTVPRPPDDPNRHAPEIVVRFKRPEGMLPVELLGSGVQQTLLVLGQMVLSPARSVGVEEPEMNLSPEWQRRLMSVFRDLVEPRPGSLEQVFITSHSPCFEFQDSFYMVEYEDQTTRVRRFPLSERERLFGPRQPLGEQRGQRLNSQDQVTLYHEILDDLGLKYGDMVFFNKNAAGRWELYTESEAMSELREYWDDASEHPA